MSRERRSLLLVIGLFVITHGLLFIHDLRVPESFLHADRGPGRLEKIELVFAPEQLTDIQELNTHDVYDWLFPDHFRTLPPLERASALGSPGDYMVEGVLWKLGGPPLVILGQVALALLATLAVMAIGPLLGLGPWASAAAALLYTFLPASLCQPHILLSEAVFNPLSMIAFYLILRGMERPFRFGVFVLALLLVSAAIMVRSQLAPFPILLAAVILYREGRGATSKATLALVVPLVLPVAWYLGILAATGAPPGESNITVGRNLAFMARNAARLAGQDIPPGDTLSMGQFLAYAARYPLELIRLKLAGAVNLIVNPGTNILLGEYLGIDLFYFGRDGARTWFQARTQNGLLGMIGFMLRQDPRWLVVFVGSILLWVATLGFGVLGLWRLTRRSPPGLAVKLLMVGYILLTLIVVQFAETRLGHRSSIEFLLALGVVAWFVLPATRPAPRLLPSRA